jgi:hypothetical protein
VVCAAERDLREHVSRVQQSSPGFFRDCLLAFHGSSLKVHDHDHEKKMLWLNNSSNPILRVNPPSLTHESSLFVQYSYSYSPSLHDVPKFILNAQRTHFKSAHTSKAHKRGKWGKIHKFPSTTTKQSENKTARTRLKRE